jgi:histidinol-phosphate aminotransferase
MGMAFAGEPIINIMNRIKPPYNISQAAQELALQALDKVEEVNDMIRILVEEREKLVIALSRLSIVENVYPSDANFLLVKTNGASALYNYLAGRGTVVRNRSNVTLCENCLRITVGTQLKMKC